MGKGKSVRYQKYQQLYKRLNQNDEKVWSYMKLQIPKVVFYILIKISYVLFTFGIIFTLDSESLDKQKIIAYATSPQNIVGLVFLAFLGITAMVIIKEIREENNFKPEVNKFLDFISDILRSIFYFSALYFIKDFVMQNSEDRMLVASLWIFTISSTLFVIRKVVKWKYFYLTDEGKGDCQAWVNTRKDKLQLLELMQDLIDQNKTQLIEKQSFDSR